MHQTLTIDGHLLAIEPEGAGHVLRLLGPDGGQRVEIALTAAGPVLRLTTGLKVELAGDLALEAQTVRIHGREGVTVSSGGDVIVHAHDDVRLDGTRIRNNC